ncbi:TetR/AcrR family transcriptional regulator [Shewanella gelidimarina]|uniref:TetR family transcriptional regulator n=1 Tax=Shewanella gelidimarina TaxID=56813 RepID=UPI00200F7E6B|nr:TetR family transcriptional regulator [Shewanella gelidimarina]MCL1058782.1 TetR/AcrR family transcriptional regulator [Shewanella gelidimarina]
MPKRSRAETKQTIEQITAAALQQMLNMGYDAMSYSTLSQATGISRTGISHHFPYKADFLTLLEPKLGALLIEDLDFSTTESLQKSWLCALETPQFSAIIKLFFAICGSSQLHTAQYKTLTLLHDKVAIELGDQGRTTVDTLLGQSAIFLFKQNRQ